MELPSAQQHEDDLHLSQNKHFTQVVCQTMPVVCQWFLCIVIFPFGAFKAVITEEPLQISTRTLSASYWPLLPSSNNRWRKTAQLP